MAAENNYRVEAGQWDNEPVLRLYDDEAGSEAMIAPGLGANCVAWAIQHEGQRLEVLETPPSPEGLRTKKFKAGIPVLWPFPGRVREARYSFESHEYHLPRTDKSGVHHIHGLVSDAMWRVVEQGAQAEGAHLALTVSAADLSQEKRDGYPFDFTLTLRFTLAGSTLTLDTEVKSNETRRDMPFGYGLHPYFRAPLLPSTETPDRSSCPVLIPAASRWPDQEGLPTAQAHSVLPAEDFRQWRPLGPDHYDHMYGDALFEGDRTTGGYRDPGAGLDVLVHADRNFRNWVLFTQPNRPSVCVEPYTCPPNAINFAAENITNDHIIIVLPGASWHSRVVLEVAKI